MRSFLSFLLCAELVGGFSFEMAEQTVSNGKTTYISFKKEEGVQYDKVAMGAKEYKVLQHPFDQELSYVLIPISYYAKPDAQKLKVFYTKGQTHTSKQLFLRIADAKYAKEELKVSDSKVHLSEKDKKRALLEYQEAMKIYNKINEYSHVDSEFMVPLDSKVTSDFGKARTYNGSLKSYHGGTDFRAAVGVPIQASNNGVVVLAKDRFYSGNTVILDHGQGIYTTYFHLSHISVQEGQTISKGEILGLAGKTGRVTGPHLHFGARVYGEQVDPLQLITLLNSHLIKGKQ